LGLLIGLSVVGTAHADGDEEHSWWPWGKSEARGGNGGARLVSNAPAQVRQECGSCHMVYPAGLLPAASWQHLMANLSQHFGNDASLDAVSSAAIGQYLSDNAGTYRRVSGMPPQDRITQSNWFQRKHNEEISAATWSRPSIGSRSNCVACHAGAEQGNFNEHSVRIPN